MKRILFLAGIVILGTALVSGGIIAWMVFSPGSFPGSSSTAEVCPPPRKLRPLPDANALAARMKYDQDIYQKVRDEALAAYAKLNPMPRPSDDEARAALRLIAYLLVWDDYYGEGLWAQLSAHVDNLLREGNRDESWQVYSDVPIFRDAYDNKEPEAADITQEMLHYGDSPYPPLFKLIAYRTALHNLASGKNDPAAHLGDVPAALPNLASRAVTEYAYLIEAHFRPHFLYVQGRDLMEAAQKDLATLTALSSGFDHAFAMADPANIAPPVLDGQFYIEEAWNARGNDWASSVTPQGWQLFVQDLARAEQTLAPLYDRAPQEAMIANAMMTVVLGEQKPRDQMELWFQRGIKADPDDFKIYMQKRWYLLPRWHGSDDDVWAFGEECAKSDNWSAKIPMILVEAISDAGDRDPSVYARPEIWEPLEKVYRDYLQRYPDSVHYRSLFVRNAVQGDHWDVAKEQFKILGDDWDHDVFDSKDEYAQMLAQAQAH